jgi:16S rRNA G966 N2-methylase RsmD
MKKYNKIPENITIIDCTACVGGDTITFCNYFDIVIPIEIDKDRYHHLIHNINMYKLNNAYPILGNCIDIIPNIKRKIDVVYIDPPWGGSLYKTKQNLELKLGDIKIEEIIIDLFEKINVILVVLKLPKNYNYTNLSQVLKKYNIIHDKSLKKIDLVYIEKK